MPVSYSGQDATEAKQDEGNATLNSVDGKVPSLGQKTMAGSVPVVIASDQTIVINADTSGLATSIKQDTGNTSLAAINGKLPALVSSRVPVDGSGVVQPISASALPLPSGASTEATLATMSGKVPSGLTVSATRLLTDSSGVTQPVSGPLTDIQLRAAAVPVSGTFFQTTQPVSAAALPLPAGASTEATLSGLSTKVPSGLTVASTRLLVDPSGVTQPVSAAALPLPAGAATSASQTTGNSSLSSIDSKVTTLNGLLTSIYARLGAIMANVTASGNVSLATDHVVLDCDGLGTAMIRITGTWTGSINFYASVKASPDATADTDYFGAAGSSYIDLDGQVAASATANGVFAFNLAGLTQIRFRPASNLTGTATIQICGSPAASMPIAISSIVFTSV